MFLLLVAGTAVSSYLAMRAAREGANARARATLIERLSGDHTFTLDELVSMHSKIDPLIASADPRERGQLLGLRGHLNGRRGHWGQAAEDFGAAVEIIPDEDGIVLQPIGVAPWFSIGWEQALEAVVEHYRGALDHLDD